MGYADLFAAADAPPLNGNLADLLIAARSGGLTAPEQGRRARRRAANARLRGAGALAAILSIEGCKTILPVEPDMTAPADAPPPAAPAAPAAPFAVAENETTEIPVAELLAAAPGATTIVTVTGAANGTAELHGSVVRFTPAAGFSGDAQIDFTYRDGAGIVRNARFEVLVDDDAAHAADPVSDGHGGHDGDGAPDGDGGQDPAPHQDDPAKQAEHLAAMALVPVAEATHVAVQSGSWFDPATWANGEVPGDGAKVVIPEGISLSYDGTSSASIFTVRVDGELHFATDRDTFLEVDTLVVTPSGHLTIGAVDNPVAADVEAVISVAANGPIDVAWDPMLLSRGLISHGEVDIHGAEKENFVRLAVDPMAGDTTLVLEAAPDGWRVGDKLVLTGTHLTDSIGPSNNPDRHDVTTEDEELTIVAINGNQIVLDRALQYDHEGARADLKAYVANYTRNVRIESENGAATPVHERGHVMFMHSDDVDVRYAEFYELGRTDKTERAFDVGDLDVVAPDSNVKGRYAVHIHRAGLSDLDDPAMLVGNAVWGSPGWGFVHHDSNAILAGNAAYNVRGAAFVAEHGNETGRWSDNIAIKSIGVATAPKDGPDVMAFDLGRNGVGFWFQGRLVDAVDNVAAGMPGGHGFVYMHRSDVETEHMLDPLTALQSDKLRYADSAFIYEPNIGKFKNNEAIATEYGLEVVKPHPFQNHDVRSVLEDFTAWETKIGIFLQYTGHYTLKNIDLVATDSGAIGAETAMGLLFGTNVFDTVVNGANIEGFPRGVYLAHDSLVEGVTDFRYIFIDTTITGAATPYVNLTAGDRILTSADLAGGPLSYVSALGEVITAGPDAPGDPNLILNGLKTDALGTTDTSTDWDPFTISYAALRGAVEENGFWQTSDGRLVTLIEEYVADRATGALAKVGLFVELPATLSLTPNANYNAVRVAPEFHGVLDLDSASPVGVADSYVVTAGEKAIFDVLANDYDPDGDAISLDGVTAPDHGHLLENDDGTITYIADVGYAGADSFFYWVEDAHGNFTKTEVTITVEI